MLFIQKSLLLAILIAATTRARVRTVASLVPSDTASLPSLVSSANEGDTIQFAPSLDSARIILQSPLTLTRGITLIGTFGSDTIRLDGDNAVRVLSIEGTTATTIQDLIITGGSALTGGGIYCTNPQARIERCVIRNNTATNGGGLWISAGRVDSCLITNNRTVASRCYGGGIMASGSALLNACTISLNHNFSSAAYGGGLHIADSAVVRHSTITHNISGMDITNGGGGGAYVLAGTTIENCRIEYNQARNGGGLYILDEAGGDTARILNCGIWYNTANQGGGVYTRQALFVNATFACNRLEGANSSGAAIRTYNGGSFQNCIVWHHPQSRIYLIGSGTSFTSCNIEEVTEGEGNISADPLFADTTQGDFSLTAESPCIDAADVSLLPDSIDTDLAGADRVQGDGLDMGAYEFAAPVAIRHIRQRPPEVARRESRAALVVLPDGRRLSTSRNGAFHIGCSRGRVHLNDPRGKRDLFDVAREK